MEFKHPALEFLAALPQFSGSVLYGSVVHLQFGTIVRMYDSNEPGRANLLSLSWTGQDAKLVVAVDAVKYVQLAANEALRLGFDPELIDADLRAFVVAMEALDVET